MKKMRRGSEDLNISFLDVVCCAFGALVLLLIIVDTSNPLVIEKSDVNLDGQIARLQEQLFKIRGETTVFNRDMTAKQEQIDYEIQRIAILRTELAQLEARFAALTRESASDDDKVGELEIALQTLTEEMQRLLADQEKKNDLIGGIPVDSEYIVFIIDTSGSMHDYAWSRMIQEMENILNIYPVVKGIQILDDMGKYMYPEYRNDWIPDTPGRRNSILSTLPSWYTTSNSSPVEGIQVAVSTFYDPSKKISLYVLGDDLLNDASITRVADRIDRINRRDGNDSCLVRIHGIGFPVQYQAPRHQRRTVNRFAALMREVTQRNCGTFVGLNDFRRG